MDPMETVWRRVKIAEQLAYKLKNISYMRLSVDPSEFLGLHDFHAFGAHFKSGYFYFLGTNRTGRELDSLNRY